MSPDHARSEPFGFLHMEFHDKTLFIDLLAVDSRYQNKHWGTELMIRAEQYGRKKGCTMSHVFVDETIAAHSAFTIDSVITPYE